MKNIYLLPTDKPSRLFLNKVNNKLLSEDISNPSLKKVLPSGSYQNIYITNDEKPKDGDWCLSFLNGIVDTITDQQGVYKVKNGDSYYEDKKIILTKDPDLIADGVQAIDDEFLEWFVKNPSCESIEVEDEGCQKWINPEELKPTKHKYIWISVYKIIIPQEEPKQSTVGKEFYESNDEIITVYKQETLEEAAKNYSIYNEQVNKAIQEAVKFGAKWQKNNYVKYISQLENHSFVGWSEDSINGYLTACATLKDNI
jgi:hypothetical protein